MAFTQFIERNAVEFRSCREASARHEPDLQEYKQFRDQELTQLETAYLQIGQRNKLRKELLHVWGISSIAELTPILTLRGENYSDKSAKTINERIYGMGGGIYLCHSWRGRDSTCGFLQGDVELVKFSPDLETVFFDWAEKMRDPVYT